MKKEDALYDWLEALNFESGKKFEVYQESNIYSLILNGRTLGVGLTKKECYIAIDTLRGYLLTNK